MRVVLVSLLVVSVTCLPQGAPPTVCQTLMPFHGGGISPQGGIPPYSIIPRRQGGRVAITVTSSLGIPFQGFLLQGRTPRREILGEFDQTTTQDGHTIQCGEPADSLTHNNPGEKNSLDVIWTPPDGYEGPIVFNATIAQSYDTFWVGVESPPVDISRRSVINDPSFNIPRQPPTTTPHYARPIAKQSSTEFDPFYSGCAVTKLCFGAPDNCVINKSCKSAVAVTVSGDRYEFELKADNAAWVGVGLSDDDKMGDDSVIECVTRNNRVDAYMSWTSGPPNSYGAARLSNPQLGIQLLNGSVVDGVLYCKIRRDAYTNVNGKVFDLINEKYNLLIASGSSATASSVSFHDLSFLASAQKQSLSDVSALAAASKLLVRLHGCFMLAAWLGTASVGILLARYYRQTWVGNQLCGKDMWFAWHRTFMILTWALTTVAFVLIFVELKAWSAEKNPHAILGTVTTILCFIQPIGAYFRPHPGTSTRPVFNWLHWLIGNSAHIIAIVTLFFAVRLTKAELPDFVDWILVAYVVVHVISHLVLSVLNCTAEKSSERRVTSFPMKDLGASGRNSGYNDRSPDAPFSNVRKGLLAVYILIIIAIVIALIVITALAPIEETWTTLKSTVMDNN
ncbi:putative ferric-chelate reductase 1 homolog isoform X2 [Cylas formicarius]|nr:putative ferric-chelate reductase 1 homolog isoform X2 [Cylas formicarius]XP_060531151.1 putative ferric-chelate reductase 1 homolog isoform X2 [Cylas formicarius]XP_060531159.1 putative ferric-chelate reductase 1 homolog isoform X2 [Cylas formicarius]